MPLSTTVINKSTVEECINPVSTVLLFATFYLEGSKYKFKIECCLTMKDDTKTLHRNKQNIDRLNVLAQGRNRPVGYTSTEGEEGQVLVYRKAAHRRIESKTA